MSIVVDRESLLVGADATATLGAIEGALAREGLTLGVPATEDEVGDWLARGAPGAPSDFADPADHRIAGFSATLRGGGHLAIRPSPRRAAGPDLSALVVGAADRFASLDHVWLRVHPAGTPRVARSTSGLELDPPVSDGEARLLDAIERELTK